MRYLLVFLITLSSLPAYSQVAPPPMSVVPDCIILSPGPRFPPNPIGLYVITVNDGAGLPVAGATVTLTFSPGAISLVAWCGAAGGPPPLNGVTDANGRIAFELFGAGSMIQPIPPTPAQFPPQPSMSWVQQASAGRSLPLFHA